MRLAISGSAGVGKTSLALALAKRLEVPCIPESYDSFYDGDGKILQPESRLAEEIIRVANRKFRQEKQAGSFVADRCPVDLFNLWLGLGLAKAEQATEKFFQLCRVRVRNYDQLIILPWNGIPLTQLDSPTERRQRQMNPWIQFHNQSTLIGIAKQWIPQNRMMAIPSAVVDLEERLNYVSGRLAGVGLPGEFRTGG